MFQRRDAEMKLDPTLRPGDVGPAADPQTASRPESEYTIGAIL
jgi:hypothetical protein